MARRSVEGTCCICGAVGPLTFEHIPPEAAFNNVRILEADVEQLLAAQTLEERRNPRTTQNQRGAGSYTLCARCNSNTGAWYVPAYIRWAQQGRRNTHPSPPYIFNRPFVIEPLPIAKQIMAMFASACGPSFFAGFSDLVRFVLNPSITGLSPEVRIFAYYVDPRSRASRQSGITGNMNIDTGVTYVYAEIAFQPFGYVLCVNSPPPHRGLLDISFMADAAPGEERTLTLPLPGLQVNSVLPADFRTEREIEQAYVAAV